MERKEKTTLSITIHRKLYQKLQTGIGKGKISKFIEELVAEKLTEKENKLAQEYQEAWKDKTRWKEFKEWEFTSLTDQQKIWAKK